MDSATVFQYAYQGTKICLTLLNDLSRTCPLSSAQVAISTARTLIATAEQIRSNKDRIKELNTRVLSLMLVIVMALKGKARKDISPELKVDIEQLTMDLAMITSVLRALSVQNAIRQILFRDENGEKIQSCSDQLDYATRKFDVTRRIREAVHLQAVTANVQRMSENIQVTHDIVVSQTAHIHPAPPSGAMPPKTPLFHGRDRIVEDIARRLYTVKSPRIAILGHGGMGKTSVALAATEHPEVVKRYAKSCFWVPCAEATSLSLFLNVLATGLQIKQVTNDLLRDIISELETSPRPRLVLLDNFETPWDLDGCRSKVEDILCMLAKLTHVALLLTMRSNYPPSESIQWERLEWSSLPALEPQASRHLYVTIHPSAESDPALDELLTSLGHTPLAITLMGKIGRDTGDLPGALLKAWNDPNIRTDLLNNGFDSRSSVNISVELSVNCNHMKANPDATTLLAILSMLPGGAHREFLPQLAPSISNLTIALATLTQLSLAELSQGSVHIHPVVRSYMLRRHPLNPVILQDVYNAYNQFVLDRTSEPGDSDFDQHVEDLAKEGANLEALLIQMQIPRSEHTGAILDTMISFSWHQYHTRPRAEMIERVVQIARDMNDIQHIAEGLYCQGHIYHMSNRYDDALASLKEARQIFETRGEGNPSAHCLLRLGEFYRWQSLIEEAKTTTEKAHQEFQSLGNARGIADSLMQLGRLSWEVGNLSEARPTLEKARDEFTKLGNPLGAAQCLYYLSEVDLTETSFDTAESGMAAARQEFLSIANKHGAGVCLTRLGVIQVATDRYADALTTFQQVLHEFQELKTPLRIAQSLEGLGVAYQKQSHYDQATAKYQEAREGFQRIGSFQGGFGAAESLECLGNTYYLQLRHDEACKTLEQAAREYQLIGWTKAYSRCLQRVKDIQLKLKLGEAAGEEVSINLEGTLFGFVLSKDAEGAWQATPAK